MVTLVTQPEGRQSASQTCHVPVCPCAELWTSDYPQANHSVGINAEGWVRKASNIKPVCRFSHLMLLQLLQVVLTVYFITFYSELEKALTGSLTEKKKREREKETDWGYD